MKYLVFYFCFMFFEQMMLTSTTPINVISRNSTSKPENIVNITISVPENTTKATNTTPDNTIYTRKAAIYVEPSRSDNLIQIPQKSAPSNCQDLDVIIKIWSLLSGFLNKEQQTYIPSEETTQIQNLLALVKQRFEEMPLIYNNLKIINEIQTLYALLEKRKSTNISNNLYLNLLPENLKQPSCRSAVLKLVEAVKTAYFELINNPQCRGEQFKEKTANLNDNKFMIDGNGLLVPANNLVVSSIPKYETTIEGHMAQQVSMNPDISVNSGLPNAYMLNGYINADQGLNSQNPLNQNFEKISTEYDIRSNVNIPYNGITNAQNGNINYLNYRNDPNNVPLLPNTNSYISNLQMNNLNHLIQNEVGLENSNIAANQLLYNQQPYNQQLYNQQTYNQQLYNINNKLLNDNKNININLENKLNDVINGKVVNAPVDNYKALELTYTVKRPAPIVYDPYYYVKYRMPYNSFLLKINEILSKNPNLKSDPTKLYYELLGGSSITELSPDLKGYGTDQILQFIFNNGALVTAKFVDETTKSNENPVPTVPYQQSAAIPQSLLSINNYQRPTMYPYGTSVNVNQPNVKNINSNVFGQGLAQTGNSQKFSTRKSYISSIPIQLPSYVTNPIVISSLPQDRNLINSMNTQALYRFGL